MKVDIYKNYISRINASIGSELFRHLYIVSESGRDTDVAHDGTLSCGIHVSSILSLVGLIDKPHATVAKTLEVMIYHGWHQADAPLPGAIIEWPVSKNGHHHIGFWLATDTVVSNSITEHVPTIHAETMDDGRKPVAYYTHPVLETYH